MGTRIDIILPDCDDESADSISLLLQNELNRIEEKISIYIPESEFSKINKSAFSEPVTTDSEILNLLKELIVLSGKTMGYFNFTLGTFLRSLKENPALADDKEKLLEMVSSTGVHFIDLNSDVSTVSFSSEHVFIDSGGFGKGFALDRIKNVMNRSVFPSFFISFGESSVLACGSHPYGDSWKTGIRNIFKEEEYIFSFNMRDEFLSVSGITPQNLKKYGTGHIINPLTGEPVTRFLHSAVTGKEGVTTEVLSTALIVSPDKTRDAIMEGFPECSAVVYEYNNNNFIPEIVYSKKPLNDERSNR